MHLYTQTELDAVLAEPAAPCKRLFDGGRLPPLSLARFSAHSNMAGPAHVPAAPPLQPNRTNQSTASCLYPASSRKSVHFVCLCLMLPIVRPLACSLGNVLVTSFHSAATGRRSTYDRAMTGLLAWAMPRGVSAWVGQAADIQWPPPHSPTAPGGSYLVTQHALARTGRVTRSSAQQAKGRGDAGRRPGGAVPPPRREGLKKAVGATPHVARVQGLHRQGGSNQEAWKMEPETAW